MWTKTKPMPAMPDHAMIHFRATGDWKSSTMSGRRPPLRPNVFGTRCPGGADSVSWLMRLLRGGAESGLRTGSGPRPPVDLACAHAPGGVVRTHATEHRTHVRNRPDVVSGSGMGHPIQRSHEGV